MTRKNLISSVVVVGLMSGLATASFAEEKIATVDMQKALQSVDSGKKAKAQLEKEFNAKKHQLDSERAAITKMGEEFKKQSLVMSDEARAKKQAELQERAVKYQELQMRSQGEIQQKERELTQPIIGRIRTLVGDIAKKKGYTVVLEKNENTVLYSQDKDDLTPEVISTFNSQSKAPTS